MVSRSVSRRRARGRLFYGSSGVSPAGEGGRRVFLIAGAFILALVTFVCGVRLGKSLSDLKRGEDFAAATAARDARSPEALEKAPEKGKKAALQNPKTEELPPPARVETPSPPRAGDAAAEKLPPPAAGAGPAEATKAPVAPKGKLTLQVAALNNFDEARDLVQRLKAKGYEAYLITGTAAAKGTWYRIRVGHFSSLPEARQFAVAFEKKEKMKTIITSSP